MDSVSDTVCNPKIRNIVVHMDSAREQAAEENIQTDTLLRICQVLDCQIGDIVKIIPVEEV